MDIKDRLDKIRTKTSWDSVTIREACGISMHLEDEKFLQFLQFFSELMPEVKYSV